MAERGVATLRDEFAAVEQRLGAAASPADRDAVKAEIIALFKAVEREIIDLGALKDDIKKLVERWKGLNGATPASASTTIPPAAPPAGATDMPSQAPQFNVEKPVLHADHIGASTFVEKGWSRLSLGDYAGAEESLHKALTLSPNDPQTEALLGWAQMLQEKHDDALLNFQKVLMREPANALARINVGYICLKKRIFGEAIEHLSKAIRLGNDRKAVLYAHFYLGLVYLEREMYEDAQNFFQKTLALGPNLIEAYYELGRAYWFNGQRTEATKAWRDGFTANKFNPWGKRCAEVLKAVDEGGAPPKSA
jgi:tetratricopeptide (TPR) repeat protein